MPPDQSVDGNNTRENNHMTDIHIAEQVAGWTGLGVKLPKELAEFIAIFEAIKWAEVDRPTVFDIRSVTTSNAEDKIRELAEEKALSDVPGGGLSPLQKAKRQVLDQAAQNVLTLAVHAVPEVIEQLRPEFETNVDAFVEAAANLPEELSAEALVAGGPSVLEHYQKTKAAASRLHGVETWLGSLRQLPAYSVLEPAGVLRVLAPATRGELVEILNAHEDRNNDSLVNGIDAALLHAARAGIDFRIQTPRESQNLLAELESQPVVSKAKFLRF
jgi:hypothetical protein